MACGSFWNANLFLHQAPFHLQSKENHFFAAEFIIFLKWKIRAILVLKRRRKNYCWGGGAEAKNQPFSMRKKESNYETNVPEKKNDYLRRKKYNLSWVAVVHVVAAIVNLWANMLWKKDRSTVSPHTGIGTKLLDQGLLFSGATRTGDIPKLSEGTTPGANSARDRKIGKIIDQEKKDCWKLAL